jgi:hypothetical protein
MGQKAAVLISIIYSEEMVTVHAVSEKRLSLIRSRVSIFIAILLGTAGRRASKKIAEIGK